MHLLPPMFENDQRPAWLNWVFLAIFLWSSWQLLGFWLPKIQGWANVLRLKPPQRVAPFPRGQRRRKLIQWWWCPMLDAEWPTEREKVLPLHAGLSQSQCARAPAIHGPPKRGRLPRIASAPAMTRATVMTNQWCSTLSVIRLWTQELLSWEFGRCHSWLVRVSAFEHDNSYWWID